MSCMSNLRDYFAAMPAGVLISRQSVLDFGSAGAVDMSLTRLVKEGSIERIAIGVYTKAIFPMPVFTAEQVARVKTSAFKKTLATHHSTFKDAFLPGGEGPHGEPRIFATDRCTSRFMLNNQYVHLKVIPGRMAALPATTAGAALQALWSVGSKNIDGEIVTRVFDTLDKSNLTSIYCSEYSLPYWLRKAIYEAA